MDADELKNMTPEEILELQKKNCIFCRIIAKEIPSYEIYSDDKVTVILDINPANEGHCLILPKTHYQILPQIPDEMIGYMFRIAKNTSRAFLKALGVKGTTIFIANGAIAGQKAPHFMIHVVPRKPGDLLFTVPKHGIEEEKIKEMKEKLHTYLNGRAVKKAIGEEKHTGSPGNHESLETRHHETVNEAAHAGKHEDSQQRKHEMVQERSEENEDDNPDEIRHDKEDEKKEARQKKDTSNLNIDDIANMFL